MNKIIEICYGSYEDALAAYRAGVKRIELNSALHLGGLTPSSGSLHLVKQNTDLKVIAMVRPRGAGFCYSDADFEVMKTDAEILMENGADGIHKDDYEVVDEKLVRELVESVSVLK